MKRVLVLGPVPPPYGGIASVMQSLLRSNLKRQYHLESFERQSVLPDGYNSFFWRNVFRLRRFISFLKKIFPKKYDLVHIHSDFNGGFPGTIVFMILTRIAGVNLLLHLHGTDWHFWHTNRPWLRRFRNELAFRIPHAIVVLYGLWKEELLSLIPTQQVHVVGNAIEDVPKPRVQDVESIKAQLGITDEHFVILTVGFVGRRKGALDTLCAVPELVRDNPGLKFVFVGGEEFPGESLPVQEKIRMDRLEPWVELVGEVPRSMVPLYLACADVFLLPSRQEGMPIAVIEALRAGLPVVVSRVGAMPEMVEDGNTGILIDPEKPEDIVQAIRSLVDNPQLRASLAQNGRTLFERQYEVGACVQKISAIYESI
mgnify:CR=1 FL=1